MAKAVFVALRPNETFISPDGPVHATPERLRRIANTFQEMKKARLTVPVPFGHQLSALPGGDLDQYLRSRYNAGYVQDVRVNQHGALEVVVDTPTLQHDRESGCLIDPIKHTAIKEISVALADQFRDGHGRVWKDAIVHAALVTHPVVSGQELRQLSLNANISGLRCFSLDAVTPKDAMTPNLPNTPPPNAAPLDDAATAPEASSAVDADLLDLLRQHGIELPDDTTDENFIENLKAALAGLTGRLEPVQGDVPPKVPAQAQEASSAQMLSLLANSEAGRQLVAEHRQQQQRQARAKLNELKLRGLKPELARDLERQIAAIATTRLSLSRSGQLSKPEVMNVLDLLDRALPNSHNITKRLAMAKEHPSPLKHEPPEMKEQVDKLKKFAGAVS